MTAAVHPSQKEYIPTLPEIHVRELSWMGKAIQWVRVTQKEGNWFYRTTVLVIGILFTLAMISIPGLSLFALWGVVEFVRQQEEDRLLFFKKELFSGAKDHSNHHFLRGRVTPLQDAKISISSSVRKRMIHDLQLKPDEAAKKSDRELLTMTAFIFDNYLTHYGLRLTS